MTRELINWFYANRKFTSARHGDIRCRTGIDRDFVVLNVGMVLQLDGFVTEINVYYAVHDEANVRTLTQTMQIDMNVIEVIVPSEVTRQHARIRR